MVELDGRGSGGVIVGDPIHWALKPPESDLGFELEESDVVWSSSGTPTASGPVDLPTSPASYSPYDHRHRRLRRPFGPERFGLSAALEEERSPLVRPRRAVVTVPATSAGPDEGASGRMLGKSAPVNVPAWPRRRGRRIGGLDDVEDGEEGKEEGDGEMEEEMVPPHVIVARSHVMTFSVVEGVGRTLKGRDLRRVRNAVWRQTGFLD